ncbi:protein LURP-one-related 7 isoform X2 [Medicago truncatula]|uniref:protein LURP-one-related 7 isoform X2 n=1 Tax=Medicago truncatula TaxID=3880 RepID=UPI000D2F31C5|nr:protein LURP-one-related 7 isoform X2 [Medicago truncatula]
MFSGGLKFLTENSKRSKKPKMETSDLEYTGTEDQHIPIDLFGSKKHAGVPRGILAFTDASGNIVFKVHRQPPDPNSSSSLKDTKLLLDSNDNPLFSIHRHHNGIWKCYKGSGDENKELVLQVKRTVKTITKVELEVFFAGERLKDNDTCDLKVIGSPFKRSCSVYKDGDLVAQSSLMYKLNQIYVSRGYLSSTIQQRYSCILKKT